MKSSWVLLILKLLFKSTRQILIFHFTELFLLMETSDWLTQISNESEVSNISKKITKKCQNYDLTSFLKITRAHFSHHTEIIEMNEYL